MKKRKFRSMQIRILKKTNKETHESSETYKYAFKKNVKGIQMLQMTDIELKYFINKTKLSDILTNFPRF